MITLKTISNTLGVELTEKRGSYFLYGKSLYGEGIDINFGINELTGGFYAKCVIHYKGETINIQSPKHGFGHRSITEARKHLSAVKQEAFKLLLTKS